MVVITGGVVSVWIYSKVTVKLPVPTFPAASVAVQVTVVVPTGNNILPEDQSQIGPEVTPMLSDAVTINVIGSSKSVQPLPSLSEVVYVKLDGTVTTGGVVSDELDDAG